MVSNQNMVSNSMELWNDRYKDYITSYTTNKTSLKSIIKDSSSLNKINDAVIIVNKIVIHTYNFLKLYYLYEYDNNRIVDINKKLINTIMKIMCNRDKRGKKPNKDTAKLKTELKKFFTNHYKPLMDTNEELSYTNLNTVLDYEATDIMTNVTNHISEHFEAFVSRYINVITCKYDNEKNIKKDSNLSYKDKKDKISKLRSGLKRLKNDIFKNENKCLNEYNHIKQDIRKNIFSDFDKEISLTKQVSSSPLQFFPGLIKMSIKISEMKEKTFNCFPLRKNIRPKYITLDTTTITHLLFRKEMNKNFYLEDGNLKLFEDSIWFTFFKTDKKVFSNKKYLFNHQISTDGIGASILLIRKNLYHKNQITKKKIIKKPYGRVLTKKQKIARRKDVKAGKIDKPKTKKNLVHSVKKPFNYKSEKYVDELTDDEKLKFKDYTIVGIDPNKGDLIYCTNGEVDMVQGKNHTRRKAKTFRYTQNQRRSEMKIKTYRTIRIRDKRKTKINGKTIIEIEDQLSDFDSKSNVYADVKEYIKAKNEVNSVLLAYYEKDLYRKLNWYTYINKQKSEAKMINNFKDTFGDPEKVLVCIGDWSEGRSMKHMEPTKGKSMRKLFRIAGFHTLLVDEYNTSCRSFETGEETEKFRRRGHPNRKKNKKNKKNKKGDESTSDDNKNKRKIRLWHGLLRFRNGLAKKSNNLPKHILMNRDLNSGLGITQKAHCAIHNIQLPSHYCRKSVTNINNINFNKITKEVQLTDMQSRNSYLKCLTLMTDFDEIKHRRASSVVI
jgi:hemerythrin